MLKPWGWADPPPVDESASSGVAVAVVFARLDARAILTLATERLSESKERSTGWDHVPTQAQPRHSRCQILFFCTVPSDALALTKCSSQRDSSESRALGVHEVQILTRYSSDPSRPPTGDFSFPPHDPFWTQTGKTTAPCCFEPPLRYIRRARPRRRPTRHANLNISRSRAYRPYSGWARRSRHDASKA
jgi:hypothetical protein